MSSQGGRPLGSAMVQLARLLAGAMLLAATGAVHPADDSARAQVEQRIRLTARLIADSPTAQRIVNSGQPDAVAHLDESRVHQALAEDLLARGDMAGARRAVDEALRHIGLARRLVPDAAVRQAAARQRYDALRASAERLIVAWHGRAAPARIDDGAMLQATSLLSAAQALAQDGRFEEATRLVANAELHVLEAINLLLHAGTLDYTERATSAAEEFRLEMARHESLDELLPIALAALKPTPEALALIERYRDTSRVLRAQAIKSQQLGDHAQALANLRDSTTYLQRALSAAGVTLPQPTGSPP